MSNRYSFGGDEHIFVEVSEEMSLEAFFKSLSMTNAVRESKIRGVTEICPANASCQIKFDPDQISPDDLLAELESEGMKGLIVDLRDNPGGLLGAAVDISDLFVESGKIVSTKGRNTITKSFEAQAEGLDTDHVLLEILEKLPEKGEDAPVKAVVVK